MADGSRLPSAHMSMSRTSSGRCQLFLEGAAPDSPGWLMRDLRERDDGDGADTQAGSKPEAAAGLGGEVRRPVITAVPTRPYLVYRPLPSARSGWPPGPEA